MFRKDVIPVRELILRNMRVQGLETPLLQKRLIDAWPIIAGSFVKKYTKNVYISNQTLFVQLTNPALRADMSMRRNEFVKKLNAQVKSNIITDIRFC